MKFSDFKDISLVDFLQFQSMEPARKTTEYYQYFAPGRDENSPSLTVYHKKNDWFDFGTRQGGDIGKLIQYLYNCDPAKALSILNEYANKNFISPCLPITNKPEPEPGESTFEIIEIKEISHWQLKNYLNERKISVELAKLFVKEVHYNTAKGTRLHSLGFRNDKGGYVLRHKGQDKPHNTKPAYFTTLPVPGSNRLNLFEGFFDAMSFLTHYRLTKIPDTFIVLNSCSMIEHVLPLLKQYERINLFLDNDATGRKTADQVKALHPVVKDYSQTLYAEYNDLNDMIMGKKLT